MITSIFNKSKPINFIIVFFIMLLAFSAANFKPFIDHASVAAFFEKTTNFFISCFIILLFHFIVSKNHLTRSNHYQILLFGLFYLMVPQTTVNINMLLANIFILLGLRRMLSLRTRLRSKKKLFDAACWFSVAAIFCFWNILFFILIFATLLLYTDNRIKNWLVPFAGLATVFVLLVSVSVIFYDDFFGAVNISTTVGYDYRVYNTPLYLTVLVMFLLFSIWTSFFYFKILQNKKKAYRPGLKIIFIYEAVAFVVVALVPQKTGSEFLFLFAPLSIILTNYIEGFKKKWIKETFLWIWVIIPFVLLML